MHVFNPKLSITSGVMWYDMDHGCGYTRDSIMVSFSVAYLLISTLSLAEQLTASFLACSVYSSSFPLVFHTYICGH